MIHYSCDCCGRSIDPNEEVRYVVRIEVEAVMAPIEDQVVENEDRDYLMEISEILDRADDEQNPLIGDGVYRRKRFDMCTECHRQFAKSPLGNKASKILDFSNN
jgi:hypothetical protein